MRLSRNNKIPRAIITQLLVLVVGLQWRQVVVVGSVEQVSISPQGNFEAADYEETATLNTTTTVTAVTAINASLVDPPQSKTSRHPRRRNYLPNTLSTATNTADAWIRQLEHSKGGKGKGKWRKRSKRKISKSMASFSMSSPSYFGTQKSSKDNKEKEHSKIQKRSNPTSYKSKFKADQDSSISTTTSSLTSLSQVKTQQSSAALQSPLDTFTLDDDPTCPKVGLCESIENNNHDCNQSASSNCCVCNAGSIEKGSCSGNGNACECNGVTASLEFVNGATITGDSCGGNGACRFNIGDILEESCSGNEACNCNYGTIQSGCCTNQGACAWNIGDIGLVIDSEDPCCTGMGSCAANEGFIEAGACTGNGCCIDNGYTGMIEQGACTGEGSCVGNTGIINAGACTGNNSCINNSGNIGENACTGNDDCPNNTDNIPSK